MYELRFNYYIWIIRHFVINKGRFGVWITQLWGREDVRKYFLEMNWLYQCWIDMKCNKVSKSTW